MDPNNPLPLNHFDVKPSYIKQLIDNNADERDYDMDLLFENSVCGMARNGKHQDDDDDEYDYTDVGPETDVDAGEDVHDNNYQPLAASSSPDPSPDPSPESEKSPVEAEKHNDDDRNDNNDYSNRENANVCPVDSVVDDGDVDNRVRPNDKDVRDADNETPRDNGDDDNDDARVETAGTHTVVDDDESPPSPRAASKCNLSVVRTRLCAALVYGYAYHTVSNLFVSLANYISNSFAAHIFGLRKK